MRRTPDYIFAADYQRGCTEKQWAKTVEDALHHYGWMFRHIRNTKGNPDGLPDYLCWRGEEYRLIELKTIKGTLRATQTRFIRDAADHRVTVYVITPDDEVLLNDILRWPEAA